MTIFSIILSLCSFGGNEYDSKGFKQCIADHIRCSAKNRIQWGRTFDSNYPSQQAINGFYQRCFLLNNGGYGKDDGYKDDYKDDKDDYNRY